MRLAILSCLAVVASAGSAAGAPEAPLASLCLPAGIVDEAVCLKEGRWEGKPFVEGGAARRSIQLVEGLSAVADLDGDGVEEVAGLVAESSAGTGSNLHLVLARQTEDATRAVATRLVGDRVQIRDLAVDGGRLRLLIVRHDADDAMCCPTEKAELVYALRDGQLAKVEERSAGTISIADLEGVTWRLSRLSWDQPAPESPEVTLTVQSGRLSGSSGCNRYTGDLKESAPRAIEIGPLATTRMLCQEPVNELEGRVLANLGAADSYSFVGGALVLSGTDGEGVLRSLFFRPER